MITSQQLSDIYNDVQKRLGFTIRKLVKSIPVTVLRSGKLFQVYRFVLDDGLNGTMPVFITCSRNGSTNIFLASALHSEHLESELVAGEFIRARLRDMENEIRIDVASAEPIEAIPAIITYQELYFTLEIMDRYNRLWF